MGRNYFAYRHGDFNNAILAAAGYNIRRFIKRHRILLDLIPMATRSPNYRPPENVFFLDDYLTN